MYSDLIISLPCVNLKYPKEIIRNQRIVPENSWEFSRAVRKFSKLPMSWEFMVLLKLAKQMLCNEILFERFCKFKRSYN